MVNIKTLIYANYLIGKCKRQYKSPLNYHEKFHTDHKAIIMTWHKKPFDKKILRRYFVAGTQDVAKAQDLPKILHQACQAGISAYQFRDKGEGSLAHHRHAQFTLAQECQALCKRFGVAFLVNDDVALAQTLHADGLHIGQQDLAQLSKHDFGKLWVGVSVHSVAQARQADWADYWGVGPIFATPTKPDHEPAVGLDFVAQLGSLGMGVPMVAIGGITPAHSAYLLAHGADGVAVVSHIARACDVAAAVRAL